MTEAVLGKLLLLKVISKSTKKKLNFLSSKRFCSLLCWCSGTQTSDRVLAKPYIFRHDLLLHCFNPSEAQSVGPFPTHMEGAGNQVCVMKRCSIRKVIFLAGRKIIRSWNKKSQQQPDLGINQTSWGLLDVVLCPHLQMTPKATGFAVNQEP